MLLFLPAFVKRSSSPPFAPLPMPLAMGTSVLPSSLTRQIQHPSPFRPICPQPKGKTNEEELFALTNDEISAQNLKQIESECLNLNITCPGGLTRESRLPVMVWIHGFVHHLLRSEVI